MCPCGSEIPYKNCCEPYITGRADAPTAAAMMRSRYTAYVKQEIDYIEKTHSPTQRKALDIEETRKWSQESEWLGLEILNTENGKTEDSVGTVEFIARFRQNGTDHEHHEISTFTRESGKWFFSDGHTPSITLVRDNPKIGRNDPCPCGSGRKYKKCCG